MKRKSILLASYIMIANVADAYLTDVAVTSGLATELNPIMNYLLDIGSGTFFFTKILMVSMAIVLLCCIKNQKAARKALWTGSGI